MNLLRSSTIFVIGLASCGIDKGRSTDPSLDVPGDHEQPRDSPAASEDLGQPDRGGDGVDRGHEAEESAAGGSKWEVVSISHHPMVKGPMHYEIIYRIVMMHKKKIRKCYMDGIDSNPALAGKVWIEFVIDAAGSVTSSEVASSTIGAPDVEKCISRVFGKMEFPEPFGGSIVIVSYPITLTPPSGSP